MNALTMPRDVERFSEAITRRLGLQFEDAKMDFLSGVLQRRLEALGRPLDAYLRGLENNPDTDEFGHLARELTVGETYFFRNIEQFRALAEVALPDRMRARASGGTLRILSAACASGEEPYSIAMVAREAIADPSWRVSIDAVDLNPAVLEKAIQGRYSTWSLRETSPEARSRWFRSEGRDVLLDDAVRASVSFTERNLASDDPDLWRPGAYDVVFCRNVLMYFAPDQARAVISRIARSLAPGGYLFLGHAETLRGVSDEFHLRHTHDAFYYQLKAEPGEASVPLARANYVRLNEPGPTSESFGEAWIDAIRDASARVQALVTPRSMPSALTATAARPRDLGPALDLMRRERFTEALSSIRDLTPQADADSDTLLLEAMLLAHSGAFSAAEAVCQRLLRVDELNAGAHYALALCRESIGDIGSAAEHDRVAVYLDPVFAMPRLHLGLLARRGGDRTSARRELEQALTLLKREDASRLLLFGGGFNREALIALCRSALRDCGGRS